MKKISFIKLSCIAALVTILLFFSLINEYPLKNDYNFVLYYTAEQNESSLYNEIWLKDVVVDGDVQRASSYGIPDGWEEYAGYLHVSGFAEGKEPLSITLSNVGQVQLDFARTDASGIIHIVGADGEQRIDLYSSETNDLEPQNISIGITPHEPNTAKTIEFSAIAALLSFGCFAIIRRYPRCFIIWQALISVALLFLSKKMYFEPVDTLFILLLSLASGVVAPYAHDADDMQHFHTRSSSIWILLLSLYTAFALVGQPLILKRTTVDISASSISYLLLLSVLLAPILYSALFLLTRLKSILTVNRQDVPFDKRGKWFILFSIMTIIYSIWLALTWPGNIPGDAINIWKIAHGRAPYWIGHPFYYYQLILLCSKIIDHPAFAIVVQYVFFASVCASILIYLCKKGLSWRFAVVFSVTFPLLLSNGIGQTTLVKDYPTATALLLLTFLFVKFIEERERFFRPLNLILLGLSFLLVALIRRNTCVVLFLCLPLFFVLSAIWIPQKRKVALCFSLFVFSAYFVMNTPVEMAYGDTAKHLNLPNNFLFQVADQLSGVEASGERLSPDTEQWMDGFMTHEEWIDAYKPYNMDAAPSEKFKQFINENTPSTVMPALLESLQKAPLVSIKNRLNKTNICWDITPVDKNQNYMYLFTQYPNEWDINYKDSYVQRALAHVLDSDSLFTSILMRVSYNIGFCVVLLYLLWLYWSRSPLRQLRWALAPVAVNVLTLMIGCSWQDFRYYYAVLPITVFMILFSVCAEANNDNEVSEQNTGLHTGIKPKYAKDSLIHHRTPDLLKLDGPPRTAERDR